MRCPDGTGSGDETQALVSLWLSLKREASEEILCETDQTLLIFWLMPNIRAQLTENLLPRNSHRDLTSILDDADTIFTTFTTCTNRIPPAALDL